MRFFLAILVLCTLPLYAQVEYSQDGTHANEIHLFHLDIANYKGTTETETKVDILVKVPYSNMQFVKEGNLYKGGYTINLRFWDKNESNILLEKTWEEKVESTNFKQTTSRSAFMISHKSFLLKPDNYVITCFYEDKDSKVTESRKFKTKIRTFTDSLSVSDIILVSHVIKNNKGTSIIPNVANIVTSQTKELPFYLEIYSDKERDVYLEFNINELKTEKSVNNMIPRKLKKGKNFVFENFSDVNFLLGDYELKVSVKNEVWTDLVTRTKKFKSAYTDLPGSIINLDKAVDQLIYIASTSQLDSISNASSLEAKLNNFFEFWDKKDPTPNTPNNEAMNEYYRRVQYANTHFKSYFEGWKSDMGWIYIILGPPDYVGRHPMDMGSKPYEIWEYYDIRRSFTFMDETGFGHYRLINPQYGDWFRYRY